MENIARSNSNCKYCNVKLTGRADKKFCSEKCRSKYHYETSLRNLPVVIATNKKQLKLYRILNDELNGKNRKVLTKAVRTEKERYFNALTHFEVQDGKYTGNLCLYDITLKNLNNGEIEIIRNNGSTKL